MSAWTETCRGTVAPWECDVTEHFTIACYFDKLEQAAANLADLLGLADVLRASVLPRHFDVRFTRELRAGDSFHIESAVLAGESVMRLGHRVVDSADGETVTWVVESWGSAVPAPRREAIAPLVAEWEGPPVEPRADPPPGAAAVATARGRVRPGDLDEQGGFGLAAFVHRFTDGCIQGLAAIGMTQAYMRSERRGYSTFELALTIKDTLRLGKPYLVETAIAHLGSSSLRFLHRLKNPHSGSEIARVGQFGVQLDLDLRRPAPFPDPIRARAANLLAATGRS
jgi:acyl-CoA thioesterase FadM